MIRTPINSSGIAPQSVAPVGDDAYVNLRAGGTGRTWSESGDRYRCVMQDDKLVRA